MGKRGLCFRTPPLCPLLSTPQLCPCRGGAVAGECGQPGGRGALRACDKGFGVSRAPREACVAAADRGPAALVLAACLGSAPRHPL